MAAQRPRGGPPATRAPTFGNLKSGVGLVVELQRGRAIDELRVESPNAGWSAEVYVAADPGSDLAAWGSAVAESTSEGGTTAFDLDGAEGRVVLLWITNLGDARSPDCDERPNGVSVSELSIV